MHLRFGVPLYFALASTVFGQAHLVVTAEGHHGVAPGLVTQDQVQAQIDRKPVPVTAWVPLRGPDAALELYIVIDDGDDSDLALQYADLRNFIMAQPPSTKVGLAYLRYGAAQIAAPVSGDRERTVKALRVPLAIPGISSSPYMGVSDLIKHWPAAEARREILLIASGIDPWDPANPQNIYLGSAIADAQKAGVIVHTMYYPEAGHLGHSYWRANWGQNFLSQISDETGGESFWQQGLATPVSLAPYLKTLAERLDNQYLLTVDTGNVKPELQPVRVQSGKAGLSYAAASKIEIGGGSSARR